MLLCRHHVTQLGPSPPVQRLALLHAEAKLADLRLTKHKSGLRSLQLRVSSAAPLQIAGLYDARVSFWEPAKWVAKTRRMSTGHPVILLLTQMAAGHAGVSGVFSGLRETALQQAFLLRATCVATQPHTEALVRYLLAPMKNNNLLQCCEAT